MLVESLSFRAAQLDDLRNEDFDIGPYDHTTLRIMIYRATLNVLDRWNLSKWLFRDIGALCHNVKTHYSRNSTSNASLFKCSWTQEIFSFDLHNSSESSLLLSFSAPRSYPILSTMNCVNSFGFCKVWKSRNSSSQVWQAKQCNEKWSRHLEAVKYQRHSDN